MINRSSKLLPRFTWQSSAPSASPTCCSEVFKLFRHDAVRMTVLIDEIKAMFIGFDG